MSCRISCRVRPRQHWVGYLLLDAGCGSGMAAQIAAERGAHVSGLDATANLIAIAKTRVPDGDFHVGNLENLPFPDGAFDVVTGFNSFQYAGNARAALAEAKRVVKTGARVVIMTWGVPDGMEAAAIQGNLSHMKLLIVFSILAVQNSILVSLIFQKHWNSYQMEGQAKLAILCEGLCIFGPCFMTLELE